MKKQLGISLLLGALALCTACGSNQTAQKPAAKKPVELNIFAAASMTESLQDIQKKYEAATPGVKLVLTLDSSGELKRQIESGAACDVFISASPKQMNQLDKEADPKLNPKHLDFIDHATRKNFLENKVVLSVPKGNPKQIKNFDDLIKRLPSGSLKLAIGNQDVPVGQYTQKIFAYYKLNPSDIESSLSYGSNVKEVTTQVKEALVDAGIIYGTDAAAAKLQVIDQATPEMCGQVIYPVAVLKNSAHAKEAKAFVDFLSSEDAQKIFKEKGFAPIK
ncbi:MAG: molybdate ABC transporter substrate-binding protein [Acidaminococcus sp.]|jgi:molybdate transport system substrate-binding protein|nr:molybdate ABC transporter substrate-binding protein [Acidaminococcus sp.]MCI2100430.1 molybdate ABC transporter substrate-binding protein [Acidaminococcus sp.]MCI2114751.1 molybdate ABC transporter substrate-binding protein [Acidaminococcus sp.]MCI2116829.1 molybdate ABC transporter substrate-binding protein [Acidaminococcus sp.]